MAQKEQEYSAEHGYIPPRERLLEIFLQSPIPLEYYNAQGIWEFGNSAALNNFGVSLKDTLGFELFTDALVPEQQRAALRRGESVRFATEFDFARVTYKTQRRDVAHFEFIMTALRDQEQKLTGFLVQTLEIKR